MFPYDTPNNNKKMSSGSIITTIDTSNDLSDLGILRIFSRTRGNPYYISNSYDIEIGLFTNPVSNVVLSSCGEFLVVTSEDGSLAILSIGIKRIKKSTCQSSEHNTIPDSLDQLTYIDDSTIDIDISKISETNSFDEVLVSRNELEEL